MRGTKLSLADARYIKRELAGLCSRNSDLNRVVSENKLKYTVIGGEIYLFSDQGGLIPLVDCPKYVQNGIVFANSSDLLGCYNRVWVDKEFMDAIDLVCGMLRGVWEVGGWLYVTYMK